MNLSRIKVIGFIPNLQRNQSYSGFDIKPVEPVVETVETEMLAKVVKMHTKPVMSQLAKVNSITKSIGRRIKSREKSSANILGTKLASFSELNSCKLAVYNYSE